ncbi:Hypothetical protein ERS075604_04368 [Mycobacteroides abscessus]|uniref:hypothetical protein n=1 Tax=Mycobacteroides abscessus TaxID=36809 RepID=UPI0005DEB0F7|nr:hypothetical protein [Mycobacteroides abscessus]CPX20493.1 Hypothetical protein ERS075604_04368 [Mycobacteroides abscessus]CRG61194.1 Hypothetical protein ERS075618_03971 [Mycobacteroides abscessus]SIF35893.1 Uncharacterised protein [Mycobacteroides abscessus subsp. abscessus]
MTETSDWVLTFAFDRDLDERELDSLGVALEEHDGSVARIPDQGVSVTVWVGGELDMLDAVYKTQEMVAGMLGEQPVGMEILREREYAQRAEAPTMPELMSAAEIADDLGVTRQRVHQLRELPAFPAPLAELRGGAVWDASAVRAFGRDWERKPGRPRAVAVG